MKARSVSGFGLKIVVTIQSGQSAERQLIMKTEAYKFWLHENVFVFLDVADEQRLERLANAFTECGGIRSSRRIFLFPKSVDTQEITQMVEELDAKDCVAIAYAGDDSGRTIFVVPQSQSAEGIRVGAE